MHIHLFKGTEIQSSQGAGCVKSKMKNTINIAFISLLLGTFSAGFSYGEEDAAKTLKLADYIKEACARDTVFQEILTDELALKYKKAISLPSKDLVLSLKNQYDFLVDYDEKDSENTLSLSKLFPFTATEIEAEYSNSLSTSTHKVTSQFTAEISQPIAEDAFGRNTRLLDKITGIEIDVAKYQIVEAYEDYLATLIQLYYDWYSAYENLKTGQNSYNENKKLLDNIREREKNKIALPIDVNKINLQVQSKRENLVSLEEQYREYLNLIKQAIRHEGSTDPKPRDSSLYKKPAIDFEAEYETFKEKSRTSLVLKLLDEKSVVEVDKYADELLPSIDLFAGYTLEGSRYDFKSNEQFFYAGASVDWPFPGQVELGNYRTSKISSRKRKLTSSNTHVQLYTDFKNLDIQIKREKELIGIAAEKIKLAEAIVRDETENYSLGRSTLNDLIDEINKLEDNKFSKISHEIQMKKLIIEWLRITDSLIKKREDISQEIKKAQ
jgi:outer membrane protein TolC